MLPRNGEAGPVFILFPAYFAAAAAVCVIAVVIGFLLSDRVDCADHQRDITGKLVELNVHRHSRLISLKEDREVVVCPGIGVQFFQERIRINRRLGLVIVKIIYGFRKAVAAEVAHNMDIDSYHAEILPEDKSHYVNKLKQRGTVMMVGDGINDAPALAFSDVGVSLGGRQTDIAAESSAVTIHSEDPERLIETLQLGRRTMDLVHQNFMATILVNSSAMLLGALGKISPLWAAVIHNTATLAVVLNSCRILNSSKQGFFARNRRAA